MSIVLDIDETVLNPLPSWVRFVNENFPVNASELEFQCAGSVQEYLKLKGFNETEICRLNEFRLSEEYNSDLQSVPGALEALEEILSTDHFIFRSYLTARYEKIDAVTRRNLKENGFPEGDIKYCGYDDNILNNKKQHILKLRDRYRSPILFIDDNIELIGELQNVSDVYAYSVLGPFKNCQIRKARRYGLENQCYEWRDLAMHFNIGKIE